MISVSAPGRIGCQPGRFAIPAHGSQPRNGYARRPDSRERRAGIVGIASGKTLVKRMLPAAELIQVGRAHPASAVAADVVGTKAVDHDQHHVATLAYRERSVEDAAAPSRPGK